VKILWIDDNYQATIICPKCRLDINIDPSKFKNAQRRQSAKCKCGEIIQFTIEYRRQYRKDVRLPGAYSIQEKRQKGEIIIRDLSLSGIRFESLMPHQISPDDTLEVIFILDNPSRKEIRKLVKVIWVDDRIVGAQYNERNLYETDLAFYLNF
jgi:PilZ domain